MQELHLLEPDEMLILLSRRPQSLDELVERAGHSLPPTLKLRRRELPALVFAHLLYFGAEGWTEVREDADDNRYSLSTSGALARDILLRGPDTWSEPRAL